MMIINGIEYPRERREYVGKIENTALFDIDRDGYVPYVAERDGVEFPYSASLSTQRIVIRVKNGVVTEATQG